MTKLFHCPLESYKERYSGQLRNWLQNNWRKAGIEVVSIEPEVGNVLQHTIKAGQVIDPAVRARHAFSQTEQIIRMVADGRISKDDVIHLDDFFHPGMEMLPYAFHQFRVRPRVTSTWWAQSVDEYDFTAKMGQWMKHYERMGLEFLDGVFVACPFLKDLIWDWYGGGIKDKVHVVGLPFDSQEVFERMPMGYQFAMQKPAHPSHMPPRKDQVVFSSRWDTEKQPDFFLNVARAVKAERPEINFVVTTSAPKMRSNSTILLDLLHKAVEEGIVELKENLTKEEYYAVLCESKIQFNCAKQDWVSFTLLEALTAGCYPIYPYFRAFPETFGVQTRPEIGRKFLYKAFVLEDAVVMLRNKLSDDCDWWTRDYIRMRQDILLPHDETWLRMANVMGLTDRKPTTKLSWEE